MTRSLSLRRRRLATARRATRNLLGGKGANLAEMASIGLPVPPGFTIATPACALYYAKGERFRDSARGRGRRGHRPCRAGDRQELRRRRRSSAGLGPLRRARVDAGDDGHRPQSRPQRRDRRRASPPPRATPASPGTATAASSRCMPTSSSASTTALFEEALEIAKEDKGVHLDTELEAARLAAARPRAIKRAGRGGAGPALPAGRPRAALGRGRRRVRLAGSRDRAKTYRRLNAHPRRLGHRGQRPGDGVRQYGRDLGHRRRLHPRSLDRRARLLWRIPDQRPGRGRRRRHPHPAISDPGRARAGGRQGAVDGRDDARGVRRAGPGLRPARAPLSRHAGHRVHRRARQLVDAADPHRQAHRQGGAADRGRHGERGPDRRGGGGAAASIRPRSTSCSTRRSIPTPTREVIAKGLPASPGRGLRQGGVRRRHRREMGRGGREGDPRPHRDQPRGHSRHARGARASSPRAAA